MPLSIKTLRELPGFWLNSSKTSLNTVLFQMIVKKHRQLIKQNALETSNFLVKTFRVFDNFDTLKTLVTKKDLKKQKGC
jgi:hypothetical protein